MLLPAYHQALAAEGNQHHPLYTVGVDPTHVPYVIRDERGLPTGFDVDVLRAIGEREGFDLQFVPTEWETILDRLENGLLDIVVSGMSVTPERQERALLSDPVNHFQFSLLVNAASPYKSVEDLNGKKIAVVQSAPIVGFLRQQLKDIDFDIVQYPTTFLVLRSIMNGEADAAFGHNFAMLYYMNTTPKDYYSGGFTSIPVPGAKQRPTVIAVRKNEQALHDKINDGLQKIKADGTFDAISKKWFGIATQ